MVALTAINININITIAGRPDSIKKIKRSTLSKMNSMRMRGERDNTQGRLETTREWAVRERGERGGTREGR